MEGQISILTIPYCIINNIKYEMNTIDNRISYDAMNNNYRETIVKHQEWYDVI
jgi:hypothetical protein